jgi:hypothetical protein
MNIEELQTAIDHWDEIKGYIWQAIPTVDHEAIFTGMEAARMWLNPNIKAAAKAICDRYGSWEPEVVEFYTNVAEAAVAAAFHPGNPTSRYAPERTREAIAAIAAALTPLGDEQ